MILTDAGKWALNVDPQETHSTMATYASYHQSSSQNPRSEGAEPVPSSRPPPSRRRDKPQLSCNLCRRRKLRCDRKHPCSYCVSRRESCVYPPSRSTTTGPKPAMHDRLMQLEQLVMSLVPEHIANDGTTQEVVARRDGSQGPATTIRHDDGSMHVTSSEQRYISGDHWAAILDSIADLKEHFDRDTPAETPESLDNFSDADLSDAPQPRHAKLLYGRSGVQTRDEILAKLPAKDVVDRYVAHYFNYQDLVSSTIHGPTFLQEYESFWRQPDEASIIWIGLLFGMIGLSILAIDGIDPASEALGLTKHSLVESCCETIVQCMMTGEYTNCGPYVLEAILHYIYVEFAMRADSNKDVGFLLALEVNIAHRMGFHRDPSHFANMTPMEEEMRRRVWATVLLSDSQVSRQMGMPQLISYLQCDTAEPRNLNDSDLFPGLTELPPSRPESEYTTTSSTIARYRMIAALNVISDLTSNVRDCSYDQVLRADQEFRKAASNIPSVMKWKSIAASLTDSAQVIMARLFVRHFFYKGQIILHHRFLHMDSPVKERDMFVYSRKACLDACLGMMEYQKILDEEMQPGGQLHSLRWRISSILNHHCLTATMILCSMVHRGQMLDRENEIIAALKRAESIWQRISPDSREAQKAAKSINLVLNKAGHGTQHAVGDAGHQENQEMLGMHGILPTSDGASEMMRQDAVPNTIALSDLENTADLNVADLLPASLEQYQDFAINMDDMNDVATLNEWMFMQSQNMSW